MESRRCSVCGRKLTSVRSIKQGAGDTCYTHKLEEIIAQNRILLDRADTTYQLLIKVEERLRERESSTKRRPR